MSPSTVAGERGVPRQHARGRRTPRTRRAPRPRASGRARAGAEPREAEREARRAADHDQRAWRAGGRRPRRTPRARPRRGRRGPPARSSTPGRLRPLARSTSRPVPSDERRPAAPGAGWRRRHRYRTRLGAASGLRRAAGPGCEIRNDEKKIWIPTMISVAAEHAPGAPRRAAPKPRSIQMRRDHRRDGDAREGGSLRRAAGRARGGSARACGRTRGPSRP